MTHSLNVPPQLINRSRNEVVFDDGVGGESGGNVNGDAVGKLVTGANVSK